MKASALVALAASLVILTSIKPAAAECVFEHQCSIGDELKIPVHCWSDNDKQPEGIIVAVPGLIFSGTAYDQFARELAQKSFNIYAIDLRGFGEWKKDEFPYADDKRIHFTQTKDDITNLLKRLRQEYPSLPIYCIGESIGANYALWEASTNPELIDGAILANVSYKVSVHPRPLWVKTFFQGLAHPKKPLNLVPYLKPTLSENKGLVQTCLAMPDTCTAMSPEDLIKAAITNRRTVQQLHQIPEDLPILIVAGKKDQIQKTKKLPEMVSKMPKSTKLVVLKDKGHLLLEHQPVDKDIEQILLDWMETTKTKQTSASASAAPSISSIQ